MSRGGDPPQKEKKKKKRVSIYEYFKICIFIKRQKKIYGEAKKTLKRP